MTKLPSKLDPRWKEILMEEKPLNFHALPTKMLMMRVKLLARDKTPQKIEEAINIAYDFFSANTNIVAKDIALLFG
jgi:hypothetical protein